MHQITQIWGLIPLGFHYCFTGGQYYATMSPGSHNPRPGRVGFGLPNGRRIGKSA